jgi:hypothetical protein
LYNGVKSMLERLAYHLKLRLPWLFVPVRRASELFTGWRFASRRRTALDQAAIDGRLDGKPAVIRPLGAADVESLHRFLSAQPAGHLQYFHPHGFSREELQQILSSNAFMTYGLYADGTLVAYALLKLAPTGSAFIGRLVGAAHGGKGLGAFLASYLYWQAAIAGLRPQSTISKQNMASLQSHSRNGPYKVTGELPNDYLLIEFDTSNAQKPELGR